MDLRNDEKQRDTSELDYSMIALPTVDTQHLPLHQRNQQQRVHPLPIPIPSPQPYPSSMIPFWPSSNQPTHPEVNSIDHKPPILKHADRYQSAIDGLDWNTQSFMTNAPSHSSATEANSSTTSVASSSAGDENAALRRRSGGNETVVSRLLDTIAKLSKLFFFTLLFIRLVMYSGFQSLCMCRRGKSTFVKPESTSSARNAVISSC